MINSPLQVCSVCVCVCVCGVWACFVCERFCTARLFVFVCLYAWRVCSNQVGVAPPSTRPSTESGTEVPLIPNFTHRHDSVHRDAHHHGHTHRNVHHHEHHHNHTAMTLYITIDTTITINTTMPTTMTIHFTIYTTRVRVWGLGLGFKV